MEYKAADNADFIGATAGAIAGGLAGWAAGMYLSYKYGMEPFVLGSAAVGSLAFSMAGARIGYEIRKRYGTKID